MTPVAILVMAYGGPNSLDEIPGYLAGIIRGRPVSAAIIKRVRHNYQQIGGRSPLLEITTRQVQALQKLLNQQGQYKCYLGMRHWSPWIEEAVRDMLADGVTHAISLVMAPHYSRMSVGQYHARVSTA
ncbi:MAG: ferrochelatase, partial [Delftia sp.]|nr:ferrochelatase [Delftia sp.]